ncbi:MAG: hypothetical protein ACYCPQ_09985 [Elusimicrobiota bacterium]
MAVFSLGRWMPGKNYGWKIFVANRRVFFRVYNRVVFFIQNENSANRRALAAALI